MCVGVIGCVYGGGGEGGCYRWPGSQPCDRSYEHEQEVVANQDSEGKELGCECKPSVEEGPGLVKACYANTAQRVQQGRRALEENLRGRRNSG